MTRDAPKPRSAATPEELLRPLLDRPPPRPTVRFRRRAWLAFQRALDPLARPRPLRQPRP